MKENSELQSITFFSNFRNSGTLSDSEYILNQDINNIVACKLRNFLMPLTIPLIDTRNNKIYLRETTSGSVITCTLTTGNYIVNGTNSNSILIQIEACLEANSPGTWNYSVSYSDITNRITISSTNGNFALVDGSDNFYYEMGMGSNLGSFAASITGTDPIDFSGVKAINIVSNMQLTKVFNRNFSVLATILLEEESLSVSTYEDSSDDYVYSNLKGLSTIRFSFYDERFRKLTINRDYQITLNFIVD